MELFKTLGVMAHDLVKAAETVEARFMGLENGVVDPVRVVVIGESWGII